MFHSCYMYFTSHGAAAVIIGTHHRMAEVIQESLAHIPVRQYQLNHYSQWGLRKNLSVLPACTPQSFDHV